MSHRQLILVLAALTLVSVIVLAPVTLLTDPLSNGAAVRVSEASGVIWGGKVRLATPQGRGLGSFEVGLSPLALLTGEARVRVSDKASGRSAILRQGKDKGVERLNGMSTVDLEGLDGRLELTHLTVLFRDGQCRRAEGQIRFRPAADPLLGKTVFAGTPACVGGDWVTRLTPVNGGGAVAMTVRIDGAGRLQAEVVMAIADPVMIQAALERGFVKDPAGVRRIVTIPLLSSARQKAVQGA